MKQNEILLEELSEQLKEKDYELENLSSEILTYKTEISKLNEELELQRRKNNVSIFEVCLWVWVCVCLCVCLCVVDWKLSACTWQSCSFFMQRNINYSYFERYIQGL